MNVRAHIAGTVPESIVDGPGIRYTIFMQGCPHHCDGCHNPQTHDPEGGVVANSADLIAEFCGNPLLSGITLSGGEPFMNPAFCLDVISAASLHGLNVWLYTGYTMEELMEMARRSDIDSVLVAIILNSVDVIVDGKFEKHLASDNLTFVGSSNQRIIDARKTMYTGKVVLWNAAGERGCENEQ